VYYVTLPVFWGSTAFLEDYFFPEKLRNIFQPDKTTPSGHLFFTAGMSQCKMPFVGDVAAFNVIFGTVKTPTADTIHINNLQISSSDRQLNEHSINSRQTKVDTNISPSGVQTDNLAFSGEGDEMVRRFDYGRAKSSQTER
jgi:hypothetical protein